MTKLSVYTLGIGLAGIEVYDLLRDEYDIQIEFGDICNILAYISIGDRIQDIERLVELWQILSAFTGKIRRACSPGIHFTKSRMFPTESFYARKVSLPIEQTAGKISGEFVMCYPPGIPILAPGK